VIAFGGEVVADGRFVDLAQDLNLLAALGVKLVLVHGARPQIEEKLKERRRRGRFHNGLRVTDDVTLTCVKEASGRLRVEIEALLSMGLPNSPMAGSDIRVASGNFVTAKPIGVVDGVDFMHRASAQGRGPGDPEAHRRQRARAAVTGRILTDRRGVQPRVRGRRRRSRGSAQGGQADLPHGRARRDGPRGELLRELTVKQAEVLLARTAQPEGEARVYLPGAVRACQHGVKRVHLISGHWTTASCWSSSRAREWGPCSPRPIETLRPARLEDIGGVLRLIEPLEADGTLVKRSRDLLEREISRFVVLVHDRMIIGCAALYPFAQERMGELACLTCIRIFAAWARASAC
jgi:amino-acid N-acetyltransferase